MGNDSDLNLTHGLYVNVEGLRARVAELEAQIVDAERWNDQHEAALLLAQKTLRDLRRLIESDAYRPRLTALIDSALSAPAAQREVELDRARKDVISWATLRSRHSDLAEPFCFACGTTKDDAHAEGCPMPRLERLEAGDE